MTSRPPLSGQEKQELTLQALGLLREQAEARVVHYKSELKTCPELDAVTAQVVFQVHQLQKAAKHGWDTQQEPKLVEQEHSSNLHSLLDRILVKDHDSVARLVRVVGKRLAKLFFQRELHSTTQNGEPKTVHLSEQGLYYALKRHSRNVRAELEVFGFSSDAVKAGALTLLAKTEHELQASFLSNRSPDLNRGLRIFSKVLFSFLKKHLPKQLATMAQATVRSAQTACQPNSVPYKIMPDRFDAFRQAWEHALASEVVDFCSDTFLERIYEVSDLQADTIAFFADPCIYGETCSVLCEFIYNDLHMDGFLDLPTNWKTQIVDGE